MRSLVDWPVYLRLTRTMRAPSRAHKSSEPGEIARSCGRKGRPAPCRRGSWLSAAFAGLRSIGLIGPSRPSTKPGGAPPRLRKADNPSATFEFVVADDHAAWEDEHPALLPASFPDAIVRYCSNVSP
jgi:hypothetical protein